MESLAFNLLKKLVQQLREHLPETRVKDGHRQAKPMWKCDGIRLRFSKLELKWRGDKVRTLAFDADTGLMDCARLPVHGRNAVNRLFPAAAAEFRKIKRLRGRVLSHR